MNRCQTPACLRAALVGYANCDSHTRQLLREAFAPDEDKRPVWLKRARFNRDLTALPA